MTKRTGREHRKKDKPMKPKKDKPIKRPIKRRCQPRKEIKTKQKLMYNDKPHPFTTTLLAIDQNMKVCCNQKSDDT